MGFRFVFRKTLIDLTSWQKTLLLLMPLAMLVAVLTSLGWEYGDWPLEMRTHYAVNRFLITTFFWMTGLFLTLLVSANAAGLIAKEDSDGTLLILASKPISRRHIVLGKFAALVVRTLLLEAILLVLLALILRFLFGLEEDTLFALLKAILWLLPYSILMMVLFGAISLALSAMTKSLVTIMVIMAILVAFSYLVGPVVNLVTQDSDTYTNSHLYYIDPSYHVRNAFVPFQEQASSGQVVPESDFTDLWTTVSHPVLSQQSSLAYNYQYPLESSPLLSPIASIAVLIVISVVSLGVAISVMERKQIH